MQVNPYLLFNGQCEAAFKFYASVLGGKIESMTTHGGSPAEQQVPKEWREKILHAQMSVGDTVLMASDAPPGYYQEPKGFSVSIQIKDQADAERIFRNLSEGGTIKMPFGQTFWSEGFGMCVDRFGTPWIVNCEKETSTIQ
jgi:PhnB protein